MPDENITKVCSKCFIEKPINKFHPRKGQCRACFNIWHSEYRKTEKGKLNEAKYRQSKKGKAVHKKYRQSKNGRKVRRGIRRRFHLTQKGKELRRRARISYRHKNKGKVYAREMVRYHVRVGNIPYPKNLNCISCNSQAAHYHHHKGYAHKNWMNIIPLCKKCHIKVHLH